MDKVSLHLTIQNDLFWPLNTLMEEEVCGKSRMKSKFYFTIKLLWFPALITRLFLFKTLLLSAFLFWFLTRLDIHFAKAHPAEGVSEGEKTQRWACVFQGQIRSLFRWEIHNYFQCFLQEKQHKPPALLKDLLGISLSHPFQISLFASLSSPLLFSSDQRFHEKLRTRAVFS